MKFFKIFNKNKKTETKEIKADNNINNNINNSYISTNSLISNFCYQNSKEEVKIDFREPETIAKIRLEGKANDKGSKRGIRLYNSQKVRTQNQWINPMTSLNTGWAQQRYSFYNYQVVNYWECMLLCQDPLMNKVINILSTDPLAKGGELIKEGLSDEEKKKIEKVLIKHREREILETCLNRSFSMGGCLLYMDFGLKNLEEKLDLKKISIKDFKGFKVIEPINCYAVEVNNYDPSKEDYMIPNKWYVLGLGVCHKSHFLQFTQNEPPFMLKPMCLYLGFPLTALIKQDIANTNSVSQGIAELIGRYRYIFLKTSRQNFITDNAYQFKERLESINLFKDNYGVDVITEDEDIIQQTTPLSGLVENESFFYQIISAKTDIPFTRLMGKSADGMNATGEGDLKNYYDKLRTIQQSIKSNKLIIDGILAGIETGKFVEFEDFIFNPLEEVNEREKTEKFKCYFDLAIALTEKLGVSNEKALDWLKNMKELKLDNIEVDKEIDNLEDFQDFETQENNDLNEKLQGNKDTN